MTSPGSRVLRSSRSAVPSGSDADPESPDKNGNTDPSPPGKEKDKGKGKANTKPPIPTPPSRGSKRKGRGAPAGGSLVQKVFQIRKDSLGEELTPGTPEDADKTDDNATENGDYAPESKAQGEFSRPSKRIKRTLHDEGKDGASTREKHSLMNDVEYDHEVEFKGVPSEDLSRDYVDLFSKAEKEAQETMSKNPVSFLYSQFPHHPHAEVFGHVFTIGRHWRCNLQLGDNSISRLFCRIQKYEDGFYCDSLSRNGRLYVNGRVVPYGSRLKLSSGDEITIVANNKYSYIYNESAEYTEANASKLTAGKVQALEKGSDVPTISVSSPNEDGEENKVKDAKDPSSAKRQHFMNILEAASQKTKGEIHPLAEFKFYLNSHLKKRLFDSLFIYLKTPQHAKVTDKLGTVSRGMLLHGPPGSHFYALELIKTMAYEMGARLLVLDDDLISSLLKAKTRRVRDRSVSESVKRNSEGPIQLSEVLPAGFGGKDQINEDSVAAQDDGLDSSAAEMERKPPSSAFPFLSANAEILTSVEEEEKDELVDDGKSLDDERSVDSSMYFPLVKEAEDSKEAKVNPHLALHKNRTYRVGDKVRFLGQIRSKLDVSSSKEKGWDAHVPKEISKIERAAQRESASINMMISAIKKIEPSVGGGGPSSYVKAPTMGAKGNVVMTFPEGSQKVLVKFEKSMAGSIAIEEYGNNLFFVNQKELRLESACVDTPEEIAVQSIVDFVRSNEGTPTILYVPNVDKSLLNTKEVCNLLGEKIKKGDLPVALIGLTCSEKSEEKDSPKREKMFPQLIFMEGKNIFQSGSTRPSFKNHLLKILSMHLNIVAPNNEKTLIAWNEMLEGDNKRMAKETNWKYLKASIEKCGAAISEEVSCKDKLLIEAELSGRSADMVIDSAIAHFLRHGGDKQKPDSRIFLNADNLNYGLRMFIARQRDNKLSKTRITNMKTDNEYEKSLLSNVIPSTDIGVDFEDIGSLDSVKNTLHELVILPLKRPELFQRGNLTKPCRGILLFGPPGTGKTMLAKAIASHSCANFLNITMSSVTSKWVGEGEKYAKAVFTVASKMAPCVIFIDEIDSMLGKRDSSYEHEGMRKIKNEFMTMWDGLTTKASERVILLAATNRPFDLDDAVLRRMPRRVLVDLPDASQRESILKVILKNENLVASFDFAELAQKLQNYSGSDLKNLAVAAAYRPIREFLKSEKAEGRDHIKESSKHKPLVIDDHEEEEIDVEVPAQVTRPLSVEDFVQAMNDISASCDENAASITELRKWNDIYGEGATKRHSVLPYFM
eukprot:Nk52_evm8s376 gene=Nk52_evmTU8s376